MNKLKINPEFKNILPPLTDEEFKSLEQQIVKEGCRDALVVWNGTIVDGHNRYNICTKHNIPFKTISMEFESSDHVLDWIISTQLSRRNLNPSQIQYAIGVQYNLRKKKQGMYEGNKNAAKNKAEENSTLKKTSDQIAAIHKIDERTVRENGNYAAAIDKIFESVPEAKQAILSRDISANKTTVIDLAKKPVEEQKAMIKTALTTKKLRLPKEAKKVTPKPDKLENKNESEVKVQHADKENDLAISISQLERIVNRFITEINPFNFQDYNNIHSEKLAKVRISLGIAKDEISTLQQKLGGKNNEFESASAS